MRKTAYCKIKPVVEVEKKIRRRKADILKAIDLGIGNGRIEAINNKIKVIVKMGYSFRNIDNLIVLLMLRCSDLKPELPFHKNINPYKIVKRKAAQYACYAKLLPQSLPKPHFLYTLIVYNKFNN